MANINLTKLARIIKSELILIALIITVLAIVAASAYTIIKRPPPYQGIKWNQIEPGKTTTSQIVKSLGEPQKSTVEGNTQTLEYSKQNDKRLITIQTQEDKAELIKEPVTGKERGNLDDYIQKFGPPEKILYGNHGQAAPGNYWGSKGLLVFGNPISGLIVEIWYFPPTTLQIFLADHLELKEEPPRQF